MQRKLHWLVCVLLIFSPLFSYGYEDYYSYSNEDEYYDQSSFEDEFPVYRDTNQDKYVSRYEDDREYYDVEEDEKPSRHKRGKSTRHKYSQLAESIPPPGEKIIIVDPRVHRWGAYDADGRLIRGGVASAGSGWCSDLGRSCRTQVGTFRIHSLGSSSCVSRKFPLGRGGAPMPYCMFFNRTQALHGSDAVGEGNMSHGCVRLAVDDAEWLRYNFARIGTKVIIRSY